MWPFIQLTLFLNIFLFLLDFTAAISVIFYPTELTFLEGDHRQVYFSIQDAGRQVNETMFKIESENPDIADIKNLTYFITEDVGTLNASFVVNGNFLGITKLRVVSVEKNNTDRKFRSFAFLKVRILKRKRAIADAFTTCVIVLVSLNYINMGCALDLQTVKSVFKKPIAPCVGFFCQYGFMPLIAYGLAQLLFTDVVLQLGLFTYACSPGGGASNMWTVLLKGNLNLSVTMTFITNCAALGMMPLWLFTLGRTLFSEIKTKVPYGNIFKFLGVMLVALAIGVAFQKYLPRVAKFCRRILAPVCIIMILFIIIFGTCAYLYMFKLFTWQIVIAATINVWLGFLFGGLAAKLMNLPVEDAIAIAIETGVQNTGISFILLQFSLPDPEKDLASVVPIAGSIMTPMPLLFIYCLQHIRDRFFKRPKTDEAYVLSHNDENISLPTPRSTDPIISSSQNAYSH